MQPIQLGIILSTLDEFDTRYPLPDYTILRFTLFVLPDIWKHQDEGGAFRSTV